MTPIGNGLNGKSVLVTGGASGIGAACAARFSDEGARVLVVDRVAPTRDGVAFFDGDVTDPTSCERAVADAVRRFGRLDAAVNCAGVGGGNTRLAELDVQQWRRIMSVNVDGTFHSMRAELAQLVRQGDGGSIVNIASIAGLVGYANAAYTASKHAVIGMTKTAALDYAPERIRVNAVCPGAVETPPFERMRDSTRTAIAETFPLARWAQPSEIAAMVAYLIGDLSTYCTGTAMAIDGGYTAR